MGRKVELLEQAKALYARGNSNYRDARLELGRALHEYVLESLREHDGIYRNKRQDMGIYRETFLKEAAKELACPEQYIRALIAVSETARLVSDGNLGSLSWDTVKLFWRFVRRVPVSKKCKTASQQEMWTLKTEFADSAKELFARAVSGELCAGETRLAVFALYSGPSAKIRRRRHRSEKVQSTVEVLTASMKLAAPGDVAEICLQLIEASEDPWAIAQRLLSELQKFKKKRPPMAG